MSFAPEDKRAWQDSQVMAELEKIAKSTGLFDGPPSEAFEPIPLKEAEGIPAWEDEDQNVDDAPEPLGVGEVVGLQAAQTVEDGLDALADNLAAAGRTREAHMVERTLSGMRRTAQLPGMPEDDPKKAKLSQAEAGYTEPALDADRTCGKCASFVPPKSCAKVQGPISSAGSCKLWKEKPSSSGIPGMPDIRPANRTDLRIVKALLSLAGDLEDEGSLELAGAVDGQVRTYMEQADLVNSPQADENKVQQEEGDAPHNPE